MHKFPKSATLSQMIDKIDYLAHISEKIGRLIEDARAKRMERRRSGN